jgi:uncharacterized protein (TIGR02001 family)
MHPIVSRIIRPCALLSLAALSAPALAVDLPGGFSASGTAALVSDYRFRAVSLTDRDPAVQGSITLSHGSGFYAGTWGSSIDGGNLYGPTEIDLYAGWAGEIGAGASLDTMIAYYSYPGGDDSFGAADYIETTAKLSRSFGPVTAAAGAGYSWDQKALAGDNLYLFADLSAAVPTTPFTLKAHLGHTDGSLAPAGTYRDWSLGVDAKAGPLTLGISYVDSDLPDQGAARRALLLSLTAGF